MKKILTSFIFFLIPVLVLGNPTFDPDKEYMITCAEFEKGGLVPDLKNKGMLIYDPDADANTDIAFWRINLVGGYYYVFQNIETGQYISYAGGRNIRLIDSPKDTDVNFALSLKGDSYFTIFISNFYEVLDYYRGEKIIGTWPETGGLNQLFSFRERGKLDDPEEGQNGGLFNLFEAFTLNNRDLVYDISSKNYFYSIPASLMDSDVKQTIRFQSGNSNRSIRIEGTIVTNSSTYTFGKVSAGKEFVIEVLENEKVVYSTKLIFTGLPIVELYNDNELYASDFYQNNSYTNGKIRVHEPNKSINPKWLNVEMRHRGASALGYNKKAFALKLRTDDNSEKLDQNFFGIRNDNYWILDAMAMDRSRMRNRVSTDLWNDFSADPYYKTQEKNMVNGTRGEYVEVFINNKYWGLYCMTDRIDRKQLKLKKFDESNNNVYGVLYKATGWTHSIMMGWEPDRGPASSKVIPLFNNNYTTWEKFEHKYPDVEDGEPGNWEPLYDVVKFVAQSTNTQLKNSIEQYVDLPVWLDYYLFLDLLLATDNHGKNAYYYMYDVTQEKKLGIAVWDLDGVFGIRWDGWDYITYPEQDLSKFLQNYEHGEHYLFYRLKRLNIANFNDKLKKRYEELRKTYFSSESLIKRFADYKELFDKTGATTREIERWNYYNNVYLDSDLDLTYLSNWITARTDYLNKMYGPFSNMERFESSVAFYPNPVSDILYVNNVTQGSLIQVFSETGICLHTIISDDTSLEINFSDYLPGRYYLKVENKGQMIIKK